MDPKLYREVLRRKAQMWDDLIEMLMAPWDGLFRPRWTAVDGISAEEIWFDLAYGRD
jgi:hypothetical protein